MPRRRTISVLFGNAPRLYAVRCPIANQTIEQRTALKIRFRKEWRLVADRPHHPSDDMIGP